MPTNIDRDDLRELLASRDPQVVEVLPHAEYQRVHLAGALPLPLEELSAQAAASLLRDDDQPVVVYCNDLQ